MERYQAGYGLSSDTVGSRLIRFRLGTQFRKTDIADGVLNFQAARLRSLDNRDINWV